LPARVAGVLERRGDGNGTNANGERHFEETPEEGVMAAGTAPQPYESEENLRMLLRDVVDHVQQLIHLEWSLARREASEAVKSLKRGAVLLAGGLFLAALAAEFLALSAVFGLATRLPAWAAAAIVGGVLLAAAALLVRPGMKALSLESARPSATIETLEETKRWLKSRT
jgi:hypothetical protein